VLTLSVIDALDVTNQKELNTFWRHSFYTALCAKHLAKEYAPHYSLDELWPPAMLHDIGKLVYLKFFPKHYEALTTYRVTQGCLFSEAENELGLPASSYFGRLLCDHWRLPSGVIDACECHTLEHLYDTQGRDATSMFRRVICVGNLLSLVSDNHLNAKTEKSIAGAVQKQMGWDEPQFLMNVADIYELREKVDDFLDQLG
jgi:HD-like signal output (HDOD) protein